MSISNPASFRAAARWQQVCAVCKTAKPWHAHHVVPEQRLSKLHLPLHDPRNALRLCVDCHMSFEWGGVDKVEVRWAHMTDENICYVFEVLGVTVVQLERRYGSVDDDPRWEKHLRGECPVCQFSQSLTTA